MSTELEKRRDHIQDWLMSHEDRLERIATDYLSPARAVEMLINLGTDNERVLQCRPLTLWRCIQVALETGLSISGAHGELWILPFRNGKTNAYDAVPVIGYKGYVELLGRGDNPAVVSPSLVYDGEEFDPNKGSGHDDAWVIYHKPDVRMRSRLVKEIGGGDGVTLRQIAEAMNERCIAAYTHVRYANGLTSCWMVDRVELDEAEQQSPGKNQPNSLWRDPQLKKWMWLKTVVRQHCKYLGMGDGPGTKRAKELDNYVDGTSVDNVMDNMSQLGFDDPEGEPNA